MALEPERKKAKHEDSNLSANECNKNERAAVPRAVLANEYTRQFETVEVYAANIKDRTKTSELIRILSDKFPLPGLEHLKRVRCVKHGKDSIIQIILCSKKKQCVEIVSPMKDLLQQNGIGSELIGEPFLTNVAKHSPLTREQFNEASTYWPVNFHEDKYISTILRGELFDDGELQLIAKFMRMAIQIAAANMMSQKFPIGAVIVDPQTNHPKAASHDLRCTGHPLQHAVMVCIDLVAQSQLSGAWQLDCEAVNGTWTIRERNLQPNENFNSVDCDNNPMDSKSSETRSIMGDRPLNLKKPSDLAKNREQVYKSTSYLCTGYDLYVTREPCVMCAMALVHSRIRRVFYGCSDSVSGALGSRYKIHTQTGLNHHFEVFSGVLEEECRNIFEQSFAQNFR